jgi:hypothetical protein
MKFLDLFTQTEDRSLLEKSCEEYLAKDGEDLEKAARDLVVLCSCSRGFMIDDGLAEPGEFTIRLLAIMSAHNADMYTYKNKDTQDLLCVTDFWSTDKNNGVIGFLGEDFDYFKGKDNLGLIRNRKHLVVGVLPAYCQKNFFILKEEGGHRLVCLELDGVAPGCY